ncbi:organic cation transporter 1-like [Drosophila busckii]|nr:organic cation transporter 1-like [Drosophila busckii]XP_017845630.1 organic cation transporter 1-like [Drosophila busckii]
MIMDFDEILNKCGNGERYQYVLLALYSYLMFVTSMHNFSQNMISFVPDHWCYHDELENKSIADVRAIYNQFENPSCTRLALVDPDGKSSIISEEHCDRWIYNYDYGFKSMNTELNWVCDSAYKAPVGHSFFFLGSMLGTLTFGLLGDRIGRILALIFANLCGFLGDFSTIFADDLTSFSLARFVSGLAVDADTYLMYILVLEYVSPDLRNYGLSIAMGIFYCIGMITSSLLAIYVGHWKIFLVCSSLPLVLIVTYYFLVQESAQWLITRNDINGAVKRLKRVAKFNSRSVSEHDFDAFRSYCQLNAQDKEQNANGKKATIKDIFKTRHLRNNMIYMLTIFTIITLCYNTLARSVEGLGISPFISFSLSALTLPVSGIIQAKIQRSFGRKATSISSMLLTGLFTATSGIVLSLWKDPSVFLLVSLMLLSRLGISIVFGATLLFSTELVPTCMRSRGLAVAHVAGAAASLLSPYIMHLGTYIRAAPSIILCLLFFSSAFICLLLPETNNRKLPMTIEEGEEFGKGDRIFGFLRRSHEEADDKKNTETHQKLMPE